MLNPDVDSPESEEQCLGEGHAGDFDQFTDVQILALIVGTRCCMSLGFYEFEPGLVGTVLLKVSQGHTGGLHKKKASRQEAVVKSGTRFSQRINGGELGRI